MRGKPTTSSQCSAAPSRATFYAPRDSKHAPRGYYMLFAVTNQGTPSVARWVKLS